MQKNTIIVQECKNDTRRTTRSTDGYKDNAVEMEENTRKQKRKTPERHQKTPERHQKGTKNKKYRKYTTLKYTPRSHQKDTEDTKKTPRRHQKQAEKKEHSTEGYESAATELQRSTRVQLQEHRRMRRNDAGTAKGAGMMQGGPRECRWVQE